MKNSGKSVASLNDSQVGMARGSLHVAHLADARPRAPKPHLLRFIAHLMHSSRIVKKK